ncbi:MAG: hypothetical protein ACJA08_003041 [Cyclobacteriaceae bacterium]|jgi:hypothetical protein
MQIQVKAFVVLFVLSCFAQTQKAHSQELSIRPDPVLYNLDELDIARKKYKRGKEPYFSEVNRLSEDAEKLLSEYPPSVLQKKHTPPNGDMHDYYSLGIYWWPNPETENGLPYIRKDGIKNPEYDEFDGPGIAKMSKSVFTLSLAYYYTQNEKYSKKAVEFLDTWFINSATKMNPHLEYGQAIPGIVEGRGIGIIETGNLLNVVNAIGFLKGSNSLTDLQFETLRKWFKKYNDWLLTSEKGWDERLWHNNHGSSYDSQVATFSWFVGQDSVAQMILDSVKVKRITRQIEPDGSQPWELERTKSMSYSIKNLDHLIENAIIAQHYGIDLWNYESEDGRSIKKAIKFLIPYMTGDKKWEYTQLGGLEAKMNGFKELIWIASHYLDDPLIDETVEILTKREQFQSEIILLFP